MIKSLLITIHWELIHVHIEDHSRKVEGREAVILGVSPGALVQVSLFLRRRSSD